MSVETVEKQDAATESDSDFDAGFSSPLEPTTTPGKSDLDEATAPAAAAAAEPAPVVTSAPAEEQYAQVTKAQLDQLLATAAMVAETKAENKRQFDTAFGQLGGIKQRIDQMQAATPAGEALEVTAEDFAELVGDFPEMSEATVKGFNRVLGKLKGTGGAAPIAQDAINKMVNEQVAAQVSEFRNQQIDETLEDITPNWREEVNTEAFGKWMDSQDDSVKALSKSARLGDAKKMLSLYATFKATPPAAATPPKPSTRQQQIEAAVAPKGVGGHATGPTEDDDFEAGFKNGR